MEIYIDKENLRSFIKAKNDPQYEDCWIDCYRMIQRQLHINYNFEKPKDFYEDEVVNKFIKSLKDGKVVTIEENNTYLEEKFPKRKLSSHTPNEFNRSQRSSVFLLSDESIGELKQMAVSLVGDYGEEVDTLKRLFCSKKDFDYHQLYNIQDKKSFPSWEQIREDELNLPLSDIIIMDRYAGAFSDNPEADLNLYKIIEILVENTRSKVNVVIICDETYGVYDKSEKKSKPVKIDKTGIVENIIDVVNKKTSHEPNVTLVINPSKEDIKAGNFHRDEEKILNHPHDRLIFTNYMLFRSGDSFYNYFDNKGQQKTAGTALDVNSLARKSNYDFAMSILDYMQIRCDKISRHFPDHIIGDKKSNYIQFS